MDPNRKKIRIYICDLANELYEIDNKSIPLGVGYVAAYCKKCFGDQVDVKVFRTFKPFWKASNDFPPDLVGFGSYDWNYNLTQIVAKEVKKLFSECLTVLGGANAVFDLDQNKKYLVDNPEIDFMIYGDGEYPFSNIVKKLIENYGEKDVVSLIKKMPMNGVRAYIDNELVMGSVTDPVLNMDDIPSPYLTGLFDDFLKNEILMPIVQNVRGCPYECRFCVSGIQSGKIRNFSFERVTAEIEYLRDKAVNRILRLSDDNLGLVESDEKIAQFIRDSFDKFNYPLALRAYSAKKQNARTKNIALILKPLMVYCISLQTTTPSVLERTKRVSASHEEIVESLKFASKNDLPTGTEIIFGLPGESLASWREVMNKAIAYRFNSIGINSLWLLRGSELNKSKFREELKYKSKFMLSENAVTITDDFFSIERDEIAVESKYFSYDDWKVFLKYQILFKTLLLYGYGREIIYYALNLGIKPAEFFDMMIDHPDRFPVIHELTSSYVERFKDHMFDTEEDLKSFVKKYLARVKGDREGLVALGHVRVLFQFLIKYFFNDKDNKLFMEIKRGILDCYNGESAEEVEEGIDFVLDLSLKLIINPNKSFVDEVVIDAKYDAKKWVQEGYNQPLSNYRLKNSKKFTLSCRNSAVVEDLIRRDKELGRTDCFNFFRYLGSSFVKRYIN